MPKALAILVIAFFGTATLAYAETPAAPHHKLKKVQAKSDAKPDEAKDDLPDGPADVPAWMGKAVGNILTGEGPLDDDAKPAKK